MTMCSILQSVCNQHDVPINIQAFTDTHICGEYCKSTNIKRKDMRKIVNTIQSQLPDYIVFLEHDYDKGYGRIYIELI